MGLTLKLFHTTDNCGRYTSTIIIWQLHLTITATYEQQYYTLWRLDPFANNLALVYRNPVELQEGKHVLSFAILLQNIKMYIFPRENCSHLAAIVQLKTIHVFYDQVLMLATFLLITCVTWHLANEELFRTWLFRKNWWIKAISVYEFLDYFQGRRR